MSLNEFFSRIWELILSAWNYPIPWHDVFELIIAILGLVVGAVALFYVVRLATWVLKILWDIVEIVFLLARSELRKQARMNTKRG